MAFIRRHRMVLVPLFVMLIVGGAALFLLRGATDEPGGNVLPGEPRVTVQPWQEDVAKRTQHGREYTFLYTVEYTDPDTNETVTEQYASTVRERGTNICCRDQAGEWVPTIAEWEEGGLGFRMKRNSWQVEVPPTLGSVYDYAVGGRTLAMQPAFVLLSDGAHTVSLGTLDTGVAGQISPGDPSKLVYADALGENSGVDIELVLECAAVHQNVVFRSKPSLPEGFDEKDARLYVYTELGLDAFTADGAVGVRIGEIPIDVSVAHLATARNVFDPISFTVQETVDGQQRETVLHQFVESTVWDSAADRNETRAARQLWRNPNDLKTYLVESIPYSFVADATGAITIDYESRNGDITEDETWTADATYYVSSDVNIGANTTLTIEPGTVVKYAESSAINVTGSSSIIIAKGEPYRYIVFTSANDDNSGETIEESSGTPAAGDYDEAIHIGSSADGTATGCTIEYCKIGYATDGLKVDRDINDIKHCIIRDCDSCGIECTGTGAPSVFNCLIVDAGGKGFYAYSYYQTFTFTVTNCTFDNCHVGLCLVQTPKAGGSLSMTGYNNLFANNTTFGVSSSCLSGTRTLDYNGWYNNYQDTAGISKGAHERNYYGTSPYTGYTGYNTSPLGEYFIQVVYTGTQTADYWYGNGTAFDVGPPTAVSSDITTTTTWSKRSGDTGPVDIGYHHPRVDKVIDDTAINIGGASAVELTINQGVVVAFNGSSAKLQFKSNAGGNVELDCDGGPDDPIVMVGKPVASMKIEASEEGAGMLLNEVSGGSETASITHTRIVDLDSGIEIAIDMEGGSTIEHCVLENCTLPLCMSGANGRDIAVSNCLLHDNATGASCDINSSSSTTMTIRNCTFDRHDVGLEVKEGAEGASVTVEDSLFTNCGCGIRVNDSAALTNLTDDEDYNAYWDCGPANSHKIWKAYSPYGEYPIGANSIQLTQNPYDSSWTEWGDQWRLDQTGECVDAGSGNSHAAGIDMSTFTTALSGGVDVGKVDIGYHYGGLNGVSSAYLYVGGNPVVNAFFTSSTTLQIYVAFGTVGGTWRIYVDDVYTEQTGNGNIDGETLDLDVWEDDEGWHTIKITYSAGDTDDIVFKVYIDENGPTTLTIIWPEDESTVPGY